ncbi:MAG: hypothetical protein C3F18_09670, partial [Nitrosomonadales bacterium]
MGDGWRGRMSEHSSHRPSPIAHHQTTVLGFDFGLKRIGVAVGDRMIGVAHPLQTIQGESNEQRFGAIAALIKEWQPG